MLALLLVLPSLQAVSDYVWTQIWYSNFTTVV